MYGKLRQTTKSDILKIFDKQTITEIERPSQISAVLLDGAAIVNIVSPLQSKNFKGYADNEMASYLRKYFAHEQIRLLDLVFDLHREGNIKEGAREKRGTGSRIRVTEKTQLPKNWKNFLRVNENKSKLFKLLAKSVVNLNVLGKTIVCTAMEKVLTNDSEDIIDELCPCYHEEARPVVQENHKAL